MAAKKQRSLVWSWALYDWANSAFATTVMAVFFPLFFKKYWAADLTAIESTAMLAYANSLSSIFLAITSPIFGAIADEGAYRKKLLLFFTILGSIGSCWLTFIAKGDWLIAAWVYSLGVVGFTASLTFYDSLLVQIVKPKDFDRVSGFGYALGYLGGGLLLAINVWMFSSGGEAGALNSFLTVGAWWLVFSIPIFLFVPEIKVGRKVALKTAAMRGFESLWHHFWELRKEKALLFFLLGYFFYIDGVNTVAKMAVDYGLAIGLEADGLVKAILLVQFIGFPSAIAFGILGEKTSPIKMIWLCLGVYLLVTVAAYFLETGTQFYFLAAVIGVVQGGIQALSRSLYARLVPPEQSAQYFGFFNMVGKFSSILGPLLVGLTAAATGSSRAGILVLSVFFVIGGIFLTQSQRARR